MHRSQPIVSEMFLRSPDVHHQWMLEGWLQENCVQFAPHSFCHKSGILDLEQRNACNFLLKIALFIVWNLPYSFAHVLQKYSPIDMPYQYISSQGDLEGTRSTSTTRKRIGTPFCKPLSLGNLRRQALKPSRVVPHRNPVELVARPSVYSSLLSTALLK